MASKHYSYDAFPTGDALDNVSILLKQSNYKGGKQSTLEIPLDDVQDVISVLRKARNEAESTNEANNLLTLKLQEPIAPEILTVITNLSLSGISVYELATQFKLSEDVIKYNLEKKGIILMDEI